METTKWKNSRKSSKTVPLPLIRKTVDKPLNKATAQAKDDYQHYWSRQSHDKCQARNRKDLKRIFRRAARRMNPNNDEG
jgi:hypothetical protein